MLADDLLSFCAGLRPVSKERRRRSQDYTDSLKAITKPENQPPKRQNRKTHSRSFSDPSRVNGPCVICLENPQTAGFAHGQRYKLIAS